VLILSKEEETSLARQIEEGKLKLIALLKKETAEKDFQKDLNNWLEECKKLNKGGGRSITLRRQQIKILKRFWEGSAADKEILQIPLRFFTNLIDKSKNGELHKLCNQIQRNIDFMVESNMPLVLRIAKEQMNKRTELLSLEIADLIQEGSIGLMRAVEKFDYAKGFRFMTYAEYWVLQAVNRAMNNQGREIRITDHGWRQHRENKQELPYAISTETIISKSYKTGDAKRLEELLIDNSTEEELSAKWIRYGIVQVLEELNPIQSEIIRLRYGLENYHEMTLAEIGKRKKLTRERVRQIEQEAFKRLREPKRLKKLKDLLND